MAITNANFPTSFDASTQYQYFTDATETTTTSNLWILKSENSSTMVTSGKYVIHYRAQLTKTSKKTVGFQVNWRLNGITAYATIEESFNPPALADTYETRAEQT